MITIKKLFPLLSVLFLLSGCDKIEAPYISENETINVEIEFPPLDNSNLFRKVLIEEYTGHRCINCPLGHQKIDELHDRFGDTLIAVGIHAGPLANTNLEFPYNFKTEAGNQLYSDYGLDPIPTAIINRNPVANGVPIDAWQNAILAVDRTQNFAAIQIINQFDAASNTLNIYTKTTMLQNYDQALQLSLFLIEDGIVSPQKNGSEIITDYVHNHVLRAGINGTYGALLTISGILEKDSAYTYGFPLSFEGKDWNINNCSIIAILHDNASKEVLQVESVKAK